MDQPAQLKRSLGLPVLIFYGLGTIIGAGVYVLIGEVGAAAGGGLAYAFLLAGIIAAFTGCSYAELSSRYPQCAGAALYLFKATGNTLVFQIAGWTVACTGLISAAAITNGFVGYFHVFFAAPDAVVIIGVACLITAVAVWGIKESALMITVITLLEIGGILLVMALGWTDNVALAWEEFLWQPLMTEPAAILIGSFLAFYAFIGFEDMVNTAEEARNPVRDMPIAIIFSLCLATFLYMAISLFALRQIGPEALASSKAPLAEIVSRAGHSPSFIALISMVAVVNGVLVQIIMASRVLYGLAVQHHAWQGFARLHPKTQTPIAATLFCGTVVLILALWFPIGVLAQSTSTIMLCLFSAVNLALVAIKLRGEPTQGVNFPIAVPIIATLLCVMLLGGRLLIS